jgi:hypothetical protein
MEFLKKHYEKIILSVVLLGLAVVAAYLPIKVNQEKEREAARKEQLIGAPAKPFPPVDLSTNQQVLAKVKTPIKFDISGRHNLFNPVPWVKKPNGELIKVKTGDEIGIGAIEVVGITPLNLIISFDGVAGDITTQPKDPKDIKYQITVIRETMGSGGKSVRAFTLGQANNLGTLKDIKGPPEAPTEAEFLPLGENKPITITRDKPFMRVIGYAADIVYPPTNLNRKGMRRGDQIFAGNDLYTIVNIEKDTVVFQAKSNQKQTPKTVATAK